ncbi:MAG TPA: BamA/TamA family outer membrane protein [Candidatus Eisenbacteria bacterium]|nr:BamA/TamA family outer membrane protein [Candidatus Eisenbacteria bacterium]
MIGSGPWGWAARFRHALLALLAPFALTVCLLFPGSSGAQPAEVLQNGAHLTGLTSAQPVFRDSVTIVAGHDYAKPGIHEFFFGDNYRMLWDTPVRVPVLDLRATAGGLTPERRVGGLQTRALAIKGADGRSYTFRGLEKEVSGILEEDLQGTVAEDLLRDQMSAQHPASELVASEITRAAGIHTQDWTLVVLPDDPALGPFQKEFAGAVGFFAEFPTGPSAGRPGTGGLVEILGYRDLYQRLDEGTALVDTREFLKARLVDLMMGDWDRHRRQWRWGRYPESPFFTPVVEDRDQAFSRYRGVMLDFARMRDSRFQNFEEEYGSLQGLTWNGRDQDRRLLSNLDAAAFDTMAAQVRAILTDEVLERAVAKMPPEWRRIDGARLLRDLKRRRDDVGVIARRFYRYLAKDVDVWMTHLAEHVDAVRAENGDLTLTIRAVGTLPSGQHAAVEGVPAAAGGAPYFRRTFRPDETDEVRLYAMGGDDRFTVTGPPGGVTIRAIGGQGNDSLLAKGSGPVKLSDDEGQNVAVGAPYDSRRYESPPRSQNSPWIGPRDWGNKTIQAPWVNYSADLGIFLGWSIDFMSYSFRKHPYSQSHFLRAGWAFGSQNGKVEYDGEFRRENRSSYWGLHAFASGVEVLRYYGLGNETEDIEDTDFTRVRQTQYLLRPSFSQPFGRGGVLSFGPLAVINKLRGQDDADSSLIELEQPYGLGDFGQVGAFAVLEFDSRDSAIFPRRGWRVTAGGAAYPEIWDVEETFGHVNGAVAWYVSAGRAITLALRGGGKSVFGRYPFQESAVIGGGTLGEIAIGEPDYTVRGFRAQRFRGDSSLWGNAEARLSLGQIRLLLPARVGLLGFSDAGRVWLDEEGSDLWHTGVGGGAWISYLNDRGVGSAGIAHSVEGDRFYFRGGFTF